ncbi:CotH kinase family protein [Mycoplasmoides pirum]|uniref:CotH kinase family protein n=1 Tax=Mycoplasmoides pirum TaxID=2122 RepID=UPI000488C4F5|nr:CotH kinase family protein [Mycoplasmoides pirum]
MAKLSWKKVTFFLTSFVLLSSTLMLTACGTSTNDSNSNSSSDQNQDIKNKVNLIFAGVQDYINKDLDNVKNSLPSDYLVSIKTGLDSIFEQSGLNVSGLKIISDDTSGIIELSYKTENGLVVKTTISGFKKDTEENSPTPEPTPPIESNPNPLPPPTPTPSITLDQFKSKIDECFEKLKSYIDSNNLKNQLASQSESNIEAELRRLLGNVNITIKTLSLTYNDTDGYILINYTLTYETLEVSNNIKLENFKTKQQLKNEVDGKIKEIFSKFETQCEAYKTNLPSRSISVMQTNLENLFSNANLTPNVIEIVPNDDNGSIKINYELTLNGLDPIKDSKEIFNFKTKSKFEEEITDKANKILESFQNEISSNSEIIKTKLPSECVDQLKENLKKAFIGAGFTTTLTSAINLSEGSITIQYELVLDGFTITNSIKFEGFQTSEQNKQELQDKIESIFTTLQNDLTSSSSTIKTFASDCADQIKTRLQNVFREQNLEFTSLETIPNNNDGTLTINYAISSNGETINGSKIFTGFSQIKKPTAPTPTVPSDKYEPHLREKIPEIRIDTETKNNEFATKNYWTDDSDIKPNFPYINAQVSINDPNDENNDKSNLTGQVKVRGNSTTKYKKKPFRIKFDAKQSMLGLNNNVQAKNWVLLADYKDLTMLRNQVALYLSNLLSRPQGLYVTDFRTVKLYLNNEYWGLYLLCEQNEVGPNRVNITETPKYYTGTDIGYLLELDTYAIWEPALEKFDIDYDGGKPLTPINQSKNPNDDSPDYEDIINTDFDPAVRSYVIKSKIYSENQRDFIQKYLSNVYCILYRAIVEKEAWKFNDDKSSIIKDDSINIETAITNVLDVDSAAITFLIQEIACDSDLWQSSFYMTVDLGPNGDGKLRFQVPWDFDSGFGFDKHYGNININWAAGSYRTEGGFRYGGNVWTILMYKSEFIKSKIIEQWNKAKSNKMFDKIFGYIDYCSTKYVEDYKENFDKWQNIGDSLIAAIKNETYDSGEADIYMAFPEFAEKCKTQADAAKYLKLWLKNRLNYLETNWNSSEDGSKR